MIVFFMTLFIISIVLLIPTILIQTSGADNGVMSSNAIAGAFGARSNEVIVKFTGYCVAIFILSALFLSVQFIRLSNINYVEPNQGSEIQQAVDDPSQDIVLPITE